MRPHMRRTHALHTRADGRMSAANAMALAPGVLFAPIERLTSPRTGGSALPSLWARATAPTTGLHTPPAAQMPLEQQGSTAGDALAEVRALKSEIAGGCTRVVPVRGPSAPGPGALRKRRGFAAIVRPYRHRGTHRPHEEAGAGQPKAQRVSWPIRGTLWVEFVRCCCLYAAVWLVGHTPACMS